MIEPAIVPPGFIDYNLSVLSDRGIREAIKSGKISITPPVSETQVQPGSLDVRIGKALVYDAEVREAAVGSLPRFNRTSATFSDPDYLSFIDAFDKAIDESDRFAKKYEEPGQAFDLPPNSFAEIYFAERISFIKRKYNLSFELRSSRGRLGLTPDSSNVRNKGREHFVEVWNNNPNTIRLYVGVPFAQLFFHPQEEAGSGHVVTDSREAAGIADAVCEGDYTMLSDYLSFALGKKALRFKRGLGVIDTNRKYDDEELYEAMDTSEGFVLSQNEAVVCQLTPRLRLPADIGVRILNQIPFFESTRQNYPGFYADNHCLNAGWVDPGYCGNATAHPIRRVMPTFFKQGFEVALGVFYKYDEPVLRPYGSGSLGSHYQDSEGVGAKS